MKKNGLRVAVRFLYILKEWKKRGVNLQKSMI